MMCPAGEIPPGFFALKKVSYTDKLINKFILIYEMNLQFLDIFAYSVPFDFSMMAIEHEEQGGGS